MFLFPNLKQKSIRSAIVVELVKPSGTKMMIITTTIIMLNELSPAST